MILLVVALHSGLVYEKGIFSSFVWIVSDPATNPVVQPLRIILDIFIMPTLFFISGFLTPRSLRNRTAGAFIVTKLRRLMLPWGIAVLTLIPLYKVIFLFSRHLPQQHVCTYFHWSNGAWSQNWLWFLPVLFLFNLLYLAGSKTGIRFPDISVKTAVIAVFALGFIISISMDGLNLQGWTKTPLLDFQNERLLIYLMMFLLGAHCERHRVFDSKPDDDKRFRIILGTFWIPVLFYYFIHMQWILESDQMIISEWAGTLLYWFSFHLSLLCLVYLMIRIFSVSLNKQGKYGRSLNRNAYGIYIVHTVVLGIIAMFLMHTALPSLLRFITLTVTAFAVSHWLTGMFRWLTQWIFKRTETKVSS